MDLVLRLDLAQDDAENRRVLDSLRRALCKVRQCWVAGVTDERDVVVDPSAERLMHSQLPLEDVTFGHKVEELLDARAEVVESVEHLAFGAGRGPGIGFDKAAVGMGGRHVEEFAGGNGVGLRDVRSALCIERLCERRTMMCRFSPIHLKECEEVKKGRRSGSLLICSLRTIIR